MKVLSVGGEVIAPKVKRELLQELTDTNLIGNLLISDNIFISVDSDNVTNDDDENYKDTDLIVSITPKYENSKIVVNSVGYFDGGNDNSGTKIKIVYSNDNGDTWNDIPTGSSKAFISSTNDTDDDDFKYQSINLNTQIITDSLNTLIFKVVFEPNKSGVTSTYVRENDKGFIRAKEIRQFD